MIDLFAGAGGLSLGFEMAGFEVVAAVEYDPVHAATHAYNFPGAPVICRDVRRVRAADLLDAARDGWDRHHPGVPWDGVVDVLAGGPSCQGFSSMGKRDVNDDRNELVGEFVRLVEDLEPRAFVMENVPGILAPQFDTLLSGAVERFQAAGYTLSNYEEPLDAVVYGVPQRRKRVFIVGVAKGYALAPVIESALGEVSAEAALLGLPSLVRRDKGDGELLKMDESQAEAYSSGLRSPYLQLLHEMPPRHQETYTNVLTGCLVTAHSPGSISRFAKVPEGGTDAVSRLWRLKRERPSRTLRAGTGSERGSFSAARPLHPTEPRVITVREAARLHSFPDWFRFHATNWHGHRQIGNSVPPLLARAVADSVRRALGEDLVKRERDSPRLVTPGDYLLKMTSSAAKTYFDAPDEDVPGKRRRKPELALAT